MDAQTAQWFREHAWPMPFHRLIDYQLVSFDDDKLVAKLPMRADLCSNVNSGGALHGGLIGTMIDSVCGYLAATSAARKMRADGVDNDVGRKRVSRLSTVDMHIDYIRPLRSDSFEASSSIVYLGSSIIRTRADILNAEGELVATGTANYSY